MVLYSVVIRRDNKSLFPPVIIQKAVSSFSSLVLTEIQKHQY